MRHYVYALAGKEDYYFNNLMYTVNPSWLELVQEEKRIHTTLFTGTIKIVFIINNDTGLRFNLSLKGTYRNVKLEKSINIEVRKDSIDCNEFTQNEVAILGINIKTTFEFRFITNLILISPFYKLVVSSTADDEEIMSEITRLSKLGIGFEKILQLKRGKIKSTQYGF